MTDEQPLWLQHKALVGEWARIVQCTRQWLEDQILSHVFARCTSQKTHGHARIARETRGFARNSPISVWFLTRATSRVSRANSPMSVCFLTRATCKKV